MAVICAIMSQQNANSGECPSVPAYCATVGPDGNRIVFARSEDWLSDGSLLIVSDEFMRLDNMR